MAQLLFAAAVKGLLAAIQVPALPADDAAHVLHQSSLAWYGAANLAGLAFIFLVRRRLHRAVPRCLVIGGLGAACWLAGLCLHSAELTLLGVAMLCLAHVCECSLPLRRLLRHVFRR